MAAIDPTQPPEADEDGNIPTVPRATLKILKSRMGGEDEDDSYLEGLMNGEYSDEDDEEDSDDNEETNGGPSDPSKSKKARQEAAIMKLIEAAKKDDSDEEMDEGTPNGTKSKKGKEKASDEDEDESEEDSDDEDEMGLEEFVICTLDTERVRFLFQIGVHLDSLTDSFAELPTTARHHRWRE
jgi:FK506-binding nuclear protein